MTTFLKDKKKLEILKKSIIFKSSLRYRISSSKKTKRLEKRKS